MNLVRFSPFEGGEKTYSTDFSSKSELSDGGAGGPDPDQDKPEILLTGLTTPQSTHVRYLLTKIVKVIIKTMPVK